MSGVRIPPPRPPPSTPRSSPPLVSRPRFEIESPSQLAHACRPRKGGARWLRGKCGARFRQRAARCGSLTGLEFHRGRAAVMGCEPRFDRMLAWSGSEATVAPARGGHGKATRVETLSRKTCPLHAQEVSSRIKDAAGSSSHSVPGRTSLQHACEALVFAGGAHSACGCEHRGS